MPVKRRFVKVNLVGIGTERYPKIRAKLRHKAYLGKGSEGKTKRVQTQIIRNGKNPRIKSLKRQFVVKKFKKPENAKHALKILGILKQAGCNTATTFRAINPNKHGFNQILLTDLTERGNKTVISLYGPIESYAHLNFSRPGHAKTDLAMEKITMLSNWKEIKKSIIEDTKKANDSGIEMYPDAWMIVIDESANIGRAVISDPGSCSEMRTNLHGLSREEVKKELSRANRIKMQMFLDDLDEYKAKT